MVDVGDGRRREDLNDSPEERTESTESGERMVLLTKIRGNIIM